MAILFRKAETADGPAVGKICYRAFKAIAESHNFPPDFPGPEITADLLTGLIDHEGFFNVVAEIDGTIVGSGFLDERNPICGIGPVTVDPSHGELMRWCLAEGLRITQTMTLMSIGLYNQPEGAWLPSVAY